MDMSVAELLVFIIPGFFSLKLLGIKNKSDFEYFVMSMFAGIIVLFVIIAILEAMPFTITIRNDYELGIPASLIVGLIYITVCCIKKNKECNICCKMKESKDQESSDHESKN
ncbi:MAG: hypothetical protein OXF30_02860 [Candidatus Saccharibacteria bacterium]|nr:hypothetical protein [Candidatus Saccharibacteria bacterium]